MIIRYVYNDRRQLVGCVCRTDDNRLGYSAVHPKDRRKLSKKLARTIALGRAEKCDVYENLPGYWHRQRNIHNGAQVPRAVVPALAALSALGPKGGA